MKRGELSEQFRLAGPLAAQHVGFHLMGVVDAILLGRYSDAALAGSGVGNNLLFAIAAVGLGIVMGMDTVVPQALGAGRIEDARRALGAGVRLAVIVGLVATLCVFATPLLLILADVDPEVAHESRVYLYVRALGVVPFLISVALRSYLAAHGKTSPLVVAVIAGNIANLALDVVLIYGVPEIGLPALGVLGAATATSFVQLLTLLVYLRALRSLEGGTPRPRSTPADLRAIARYGIPVGGQLFAEVGIFGVATVMAAHMGKVPAAAHSIALNLSSLTFSVALGIGAAASVRVGHAVGAGDLVLARRRGLHAVALGIAVMSCFAAVFVIVPHVIATWFTNDPSVVAATMPLLQIAALFQLSDGTQAIGAGALRGLGHTRATLWGNLLGHYAIGLPISLALGFAAHLGAPGLWWGLSVGLTVTAGYLVVRFVVGTRSTSQSPR
jgi:MATE family multidrug resistance protein